MLYFFFFNDTATTEIYTLSLHDALPISRRWPVSTLPDSPRTCMRRAIRSEEHTSELQSQSNLVCRLLLEKKNTMRSFGGTNREALSPETCLQHRRSLSCPENHSLTKNKR